MASSHMKRGSILLILREVQIKPTKKKKKKGATSHQSEWPSLVSLQVTNEGEGVEKWEHSYTVSRNVNWYNQDGKQHGGSSENYIHGTTI